LVLIDFGAEYACMASDMTRTIPASGRFSKDNTPFILQF
jgi:Xaa-Pro aminopeptidase